MHDLDRRIRKLTSILDVAKAMTLERDVDVLLGRIVEEAARVVDADRCSLFLVDRDRALLRTRVAQGIDRAREIVLPLGVGIAGHVAATGEVVNLPDAYADPRFARDVDARTGYRTRNLLCVPMLDTRDEVVGVLQALNKEGGPFVQEDEELLAALGGQAAAAIESARLHEDIQRLFEGFVKASVIAIESRDPSTAGHSERVASLTLGLGDAVEAGGAGAFRGLRFSKEQRREIRYAALLHDFGKVGVREHVLTKANKLFPHELEILETRFELARRSLEVESLKRRLDLVARGAAREELLAEELDHEARAAELDRFLALVHACNRPTVLPAGGFEGLAALHATTFPGRDGPRPLLGADELVRLSIPKGSLSPEERLEIESHVSHTFRFLAQIPWTRGLERVPEIAHGHHEKLDGTGYPRALKAPEIAVEARMMAVADIYDALTAADRPYKKAVPHGLAVRILEDEVRAGALEPDLVRLFVEADVPARVLGKAEASA